MAADPKQLRNLKIKTGVVKRYTKEKQSYEKEAADQERKIEKFLAEGKDELFMRQQNGCLKESYLMVPEVQNKLMAAYEELKTLCSAEDKVLEGTEEYKTALLVLKDAEAHLPTSFTGN